MATNDPPGALSEVSAATVPARCRGDEVLDASPIPFAGSEHLFCGCLPDGDPACFAAPSVTRARDWSSVAVARGSKRSETPAAVYSLGVCLNV
jgi:hypothetical protein